MRCFYVLIHGRISWIEKASEGDREPDVDRPTGFYCHRYVLASDESQAEAAASERARENLEKQTGWIGCGYIALDLEAEGVAPAPLLKLLRPDNCGHSFYREE